MRNIAFLVCAVMSSTTLAGPLRFDMGPADSPVEKGYEAVTNTTIYNEEIGWGWLRACENVFDSTHAMYPRFGTDYTRAMVTEPATDLTIDGVNSSQDMVFQADLPNGKYWILARVGDLGKATFKTAISVNGELRDNKIDAFTFRDRGTLDNPGIAGGVNRVRLAAEVTDGRLEIRFHRAANRKNPYAEIGFQPPLNAEGKLMGGGEGGAAETLDQLMPFTRNSVLGLEIYPDSRARFWMEAGKLRTSVVGAEEFVEAFNARDYRRAQRICEGNPAIESYPLEFACAFLWLAGRPELDDIQSLAAKAMDLLEQCGASKSPDSATKDLYTTAWLFETAMTLRDQDFEAVGIEKMRSLEGVWLAEQFLRQIPEADPLYLTAQIELARLNAGVDPNCNNEVSYRAYKIFFDMQKQFPDNKYVAMYLTGVTDIENRGAGKDVRLLHTAEEIKAARKGLREAMVDLKYDWGYEGAPEWAVMVRDGLGWSTDIVEWWVQNRQHEDGSLNRKGWSDDCEILRGWAPLAAVGHSPIILEGVEKLAEGVWNTPMMNREWGIEDGRADVEHITEMAGDSIPPSIYLHFGNPIYIERAMRTMKKIRDFFTGINPEGLRLFKSVNVGVDYLDPDPHWAMDSLYAQRLGLTGNLLMWYNRNPETVRVMGEWSDSWLKYAKTTLQGKPEGILPFAIAFEGGRICFPEDDEWYEAPYTGGGRQGFIRMNYLYNLLLQIYVCTGDPKYLEPIDAAFSIVEKFDANVPQDAQPGSEEWVAESLYRWDADFSPILAKAKMLTGTNRYDKFLRENAGGAVEQYGVLLHFMDGPYVRYLGTNDKQYVIDGNKGLAYLLNQRSFPMVTTEVVMTDRAGLGFDEESAPIGPMTGDIRGWGGSVPSYAITWRNINRHLAALVTPHASNSRLKVLLYNFNQEPMDAEMLLWRLDVGGEYELTMGPDTNNDDAADTVETKKRFVHEHRGDAVAVTIPSQKTMVLDIRQTKKGHNNFLVPDLAMAPQDIVVKDKTVEVTVHNIGCKDSGPFEIELYDGGSKSGRLMGKQSVSNLKAPNDLEAKTITVSFQRDAKTSESGTVTAVADSEDRIYELTEVNNSLSIPKTPVWSR